MSVVDNAQVEKRHAIFLVDYIVQRRSLTQTTRKYKHTTWRWAVRPPSAASSVREWRPARSTC